MTLRGILDGIKQQLKTSVAFRFVTGNQSADMDSVVSAIAYAYFYHIKNPHQEPFFPMVNITREELKLRKDIVMLLNRHSITSSTLFFLDDVQELVGSSSDKVELALVDHCNIQGEFLWGLYHQKRLEVTAIIDHHSDENAFENASPRVIHSNGSCSALVFNYWRSQIAGHIDAEIVELLLGPLLIDTSNMTQKVEDGDLEAFAQYKQILSEAQLPDMFVLPSGLEGFYSSLKIAKKDLAGFSVFDILRKDYKQFQFEKKSGGSVSVGFSSILKPISWVLTKFSSDDVLEAFQQMSRCFSLDALIITLSYTRKDNRVYSREFCYTTEDSSLEHLADYASSELRLDDDVYNLHAASSGLSAVKAKKPFRIYNQRNTQASRKQVVPVVKSIIATL